jgi:hypothetical protein
VKRIELGDIRICRRCGRGRAQLVTDDGETISIPLDPARARVLGTPTTEADVGWLTALVLDRFTQEGRTLQEIVLDLDGGALRALVSSRRDAELEVFACTPQEGVDLASRAAVPLYATDDALAHATGAAAAPGETLH